MSRRSQARQPDPYVLEIPAWNGSSVVTLRFSTHSISTDPSDTPANTFYDGRIIDPGSIDRKLFADNATSGKPNVDVGFFEIINPDGRQDYLIGYGYNRVATLKNLATRNASIAASPSILKCVVQGVESPDALRTLRFRTRGRMSELDKPLLTRRYLGTTISADSTDLAEGDESLQGQIVPYVFGTAPHVPGVLVNKVYRLWQFAGNGCASIVLYDGAIPLTNVGDFGSLPALIAAASSVAPSKYATCLSSGIALTGGDTAFAVTADIVEGATLSLRSAARVTQRMLALVSTVVSGDIDTATFDAFHAFNPAEVGILVNSDQSALDAISQVADSVGGVVLDTADGTFEAQWLTEPLSTTDASYTLRDLLDGNSLQIFAGPDSEGQGVPAYSIVVNWGRIWKQFSLGDLAPVIAEATSGGDLALKQLLTNSTGLRQVQRADTSVQSAYPQAVELTFNTLIVNQADAVAECLRKLALHKVRRDRIVFPTFFDRGDVECGRSVKVTLDRYGLSGGKSFVVMGRKDDFAKRRRILNLWG